MTLDQMADVLEGLAATLEKFLGKGTVNDFRKVSDCFRRFPGETVAAFCQFVMQAKDGKPAARGPGGAVDENKVEEFVSKIRNFLEHRRDYDFAAIRELVTQMTRLKIPEIKAVGNRIECPFTERTKGAMLARLENWLNGIKLSSDQTSFSLTGTGT